jgi:predicted peroxiredoxin
MGQGSQVVSRNRLEQSFHYEDVEELAGLADMAIDAGLELSRWREASSTTKSTPTKIASRKRRPRR